MNTYEQRVRAMEAEGMTRSDAQAVIDAEDLQYTRLHTRWQRNFVRPGKDALSADEWHRMIELERRIGK